MYDIAPTPVGDQPPKRAAKKTVADVGGSDKQATDQFSTAAVLADPVLFLEGAFKNVMMLHLGNEGRVIGRQLGISNESWRCWGCSTSERTLQEMAVWAGANF